MRHGASRSSRAEGDELRRRALAIWPGLDRTKLARTCGKPERVARLIGRRTALPLDVILGMLGFGPTQGG